MIAAPMDVSSIGLEEKVELGVYQSSLNLIQLQEGFFSTENESCSCRKGFHGCSEVSLMVEGAVW